MRNKILFIFKVYILSFLMYLTATAQKSNLVIDKTTVKIASKLVVQANPATKIEQQDNQGGGQVKSTATPRTTTWFRQLTMNKADTKLETVLLLRVTRATRKGEGPFSQEVNIDTESPFATNEAEKVELEGLQRVIDQPEKITVSLADWHYMADHKVSLFLSNWIMDLPPLHPVRELSGIIFPVNHLSSSQWKDTLQTKDGFYTNTYKITEKTASNVRIAVSGVFTPNSEPLKIDTTPLPKTPGRATVTVQIKLNSDVFDGQLSVDPTTGLVSSLRLKRNANESRSLFGTVSSLTRTYVYEVDNKLEK